MTDNETKASTLEQVALVHQLSQAVAQSPRAFGRDARVAIGIGTAQAPTWLSVELSATGPGRAVTQSWVADDVDAALFLPSDGAPSLVSGDADLLKATFEHFLGGQSPLGFRLAMMAAT